MTRQRLIGAAVLALALFVVRAAGAATPEPQDDIGTFIDKDASISVTIFELAGAVALTHAQGYPCHAVSLATFNSHGVLILGCDAAKHLYIMVLPTPDAPAAFKVLVQK